MRRAAVLNARETDHFFRRIRASHASHAPLVVSIAPVVYRPVLTSSCPTCVHRPPPTLNGSGIYYQINRELEVV